jgi:hypothetical protein
MPKAIEVVSINVFEGDGTLSRSGHGGNKETCRTRNGCGCAHEIGLGSGDGSLRSLSQYRVYDLNKLLEATSNRLSIINDEELQELYKQALASFSDEFSTGSRACLLSVTNVQGAARTCQSQH